MKVIEKKDNFFAIAIQAGEKLVLADGNAKILMSVVASEDCIINAYRKVDFMPLEYQ